MHDVELPESKVGDLRVKTPRLVIDVVLEHRQVFVSHLTTYRGEPVCSYNPRFSITKRRSMSFNQSFGDELVDAVAP